MTELGLTTDKSSPAKSYAYIPEDGRLVPSYGVATDLATAEYDSLPFCNIIGDPVRIAVTFPDGIPGEYVADLPNSTSKPFSFTRKANSANTNWVLTSNDGSTWISATQGIDQTTNTWRGSVSAGSVVLHSFESPSNPTKAANNSKVVGGVGDVFEGCSYKIEHGNRLQSSLAGIGKSSVDKYFGRLSLDSYTIQADGLLEPNPAYSPKHAAIDLSAPNNSSPAVKAECTITEKDGMLYGQFHGCSMSHDGTDWGDDGKIPIVNGEGTKTDDNRVTQKTFCHHTVFPLGAVSYVNSSQAKE